MILVSKDAGRPLDGDSSQCLAVGLWIISAMTKFKKTTHPYLI